MKEQSSKNDLLEKSNLKRIDHTYISHEITHLLHLDRGFFFTIRELFLRPGKTVRNFLFENRNSHVKPILFLIICAVIFTLTIHWLHVSADLFNIDRITPLKGKIRSEEIGKWIRQNTGYAQLLLAFFVAIWVEVFFKKFKYNIYEILVLMAFVFGEALLILTIFIIAGEIFGTGIFVLLGVALYLFYIVWAIGQFFGEKQILNYLKSALSYSFGVLTYLVTLIFIAYILKLILP